MIEEQIEVLQQFPPFHPKKIEYESNLEKELKALLEQEESYRQQKEHFEKLYVWSQGVVRAVQWLETHLEAYCNSLFSDLALTTNVSKIAVADYRAYSKALDEITYNLQESQDFFDASLDGRLRNYHQLEKCMIEAQLQVLRKYPEDNPRRKHVEDELKKDLEYVEDNMKENPVVLKHRERMRSMHQDFFKLLKWQRERMLRMPFDEPELFIGDVESLKREITEHEERKKRAQGRESEPTSQKGGDNNHIQSHAGDLSSNGNTSNEYIRDESGLHVSYKHYAQAANNQQTSNATSTSTTTTAAATSAKCPVTGAQLEQGAVCPVMNSSHPSSEKIAKGYIHKVYEEQ